MMNMKRKIVLAMSITMILVLLSNISAGVSTGTSKYNNMKETNNQYSEIKSNNIYHFNFDVDGNGRIDPFDIITVMSHYGCEVGTGCEMCDRSDVNKNRVVDVHDSDLVTLIINIMFWERYSSIIPDQILIPKSFLEIE